MQDFIASVSIAAGETVWREPFWFHDLKEVPESEAGNSR